MIPCAIGRANSISIAVDGSRTLAADEYAAMARHCRDCSSFRSFAVISFSRWAAGDTFSLL